MQQLHWAELPTAALARLTHAAHCEGQPPPLHEFCFFRQEQPGERPPTEAGAAMLELIRQNRFPGFALAFYEPLHAAGQGQPAPQRLALIAKDAILLAPTPVPGGWSGFIIAEGQAQGQTRQFRWPGDPEPCCSLAVPHAASGGGAVWAEAAASLPIRPFRHTPEPPGSQLP